MCGCDTDIPTGADGTDGKTILNGSGAPAPSLGTDGDFYLDTDTQELYGPRTAGAWGAGVPLNGTDGVDGVDGTGTVVFAKVLAGLPIGDNVVMTNAEFVSAGFAGGYPQNWQWELWIEGPLLSLEITNSPIYFNLAVGSIYVEMATGDFHLVTIAAIDPADPVRLVIIGKSA